MPTDASERQRAVGQLDQAAVRKPISEHAYRREVRASSQYVEKTLREIRTYQLEGRHKRGHELERQLLRSRALCLTASEAARKSLGARAREKARANGTFKRGRQYGPTHTETYHVAQNLNLWKATDEEVVYFFEPKRRGGERMICSFKLEHRARQEMLLTVLANRAKAHPSQWVRKQDGFGQMQWEIAALIDSGAVSFALELDIQSCFNSVNVEALSSALHLPKQVVMANLDFASLNLVDGRGRGTTGHPVGDGNTGSIKGGTRTQQSGQTETPQAGEGETGRLSVNGHAAALCHHRRGISQGSCSSSIISEELIAQILHQAGVAVPMYVWCDNIILLAQSRADLEKASRTLRAVFSAALTGPFCLRASSKPRDIKDGFDAIGVNYARQGTQTIVRPSEDKLSQLRGDQKRDEMTVRAGTLTLREAARNLRSRIAAYPAWTYRDTFERYAMRNLAEAARWHQFWLTVPKHERLTLIRTMAVAHPLSSSRPRGLPQVARRRSYSRTSHVMYTRGS